MYRSNAQIQTNQSSKPADDDGDDHANVCKKNLITFAVVLLK